MKIKDKYLFWIMSILNEMFDTDSLDAGEIPGQLSQEEVEELQTYTKKINKRLDEKYGQV